MTTNREDQLRMEVVKGAKLIFSKGLVETGEGNVSIRNGKKEELFITPSLINMIPLAKTKLSILISKGLL